MRVLIDESLPRQLVPLLNGHDVRMVQAEGWSSVKNSDLLRRAAAAGYDVFVTTDRKLEYQQNIPCAGLAVVVVQAHTNRIEDIAPPAPAAADHPAHRSAAHHAADLAARPGSRTLHARAVAPRDPIGVLVARLSSL